MESFSLNVSSQSNEVPFEGPIPLELTITYEGKDEITILSEQFIEVEFEPPSGWALREKSSLRNLNGWLPTVTLTTGQSLSPVVYIHDYFSSITAGKIQLPVTVKIWRKAEDAKEPIVLREVCEFTVMEPDPVGFAERIAEIHRQIRSQQSGEKRLELYQSLASLSHDDLIPTFLDSLLDPAMLMFHSTARRRLVELADTDEKRQPLINHLASHGGRYDGEFFRLWQEGQVRLSDEEVAQVCESSSVWTRLFCLEHYREQYNRKGLIDSLEAELGELTERVRKLKKS